VASQQNDESYTATVHYCDEPQPESRIHSAPNRRYSCALRR
jgi:hypothetical protein